MIPLSFYTHTFADADIAGITQMGSMAPTTGGKAITLKKKNVTGEKKKKKKKENY